MCWWYLPLYMYSQKSTQPTFHDRYRIRMSLFRQSTAAAAQSIFSFSQLHACINRPQQICVLSGLTSRTGLRHFSVCILSRILFVNCLGLNLSNNTIRSWWVIWVRAWLDHAPGDRRTTVSSCLQAQSCSRKLLPALSLNNIKWHAQKVSCQGYTALLLTPFHLTNITKKSLCRAGGQL